MKYLLNIILFFINIILISLFFIWSKLLCISLLLLLILDSFTIKVIPKQLKKVISKDLYKALKYLYIIVLPVIFAVFFRTFFFDYYFVPSSSMERTLFPNDYVVINKIKYGVKLPKHIRNTPVIGSFFNPPENEYDLYTSLKSFKKLKREDIVVFKAVDNSDKFLIKRIIGLPNDTIQIKQAKVFINSKELKEKENYSYNYVYKQNNGVSLFENYSNKEVLELSPIKKKKYQKNIIKNINSNYFLFPSNKQQKWTRDNYGKLVIPKKGMQLELTSENIAIYRKVILKFEKMDLKKVNQSFYIFKNDYYFMIGDNRHNSMDSRSFGFVPESYIQGKMVAIF